MRVNSQDRKKSAAHWVDTVFVGVVRGRFGGVTEYLDWHSQCQKM